MLRTDIQCKWRTIGRSVTGFQFVTCRLPRTAPTFCTTKLRSCNSLKSKTDTFEFVVRSDFENMYETGFKCVVLLFMQDETQTLKLKVLELVEENRLLHEEIKRNAVSDILHHGIEVPGVTIALLI